LHPLTKEILIRFRDNASSVDASSKRYIITAPQDDFILLPSDQVFVLMQFDQGMEYRPTWGDGKAINDRIPRTAAGGGPVPTTPKPGDPS